MTLPFRLIRTLLGAGVASSILGDGCGLRDIDVGDADCQLVGAAAGGAAAATAGAEEAERS
jgi:hypothetical protein